MSLTTYDTTGIINSCPLYENEIQRSQYIKSWTNQQLSTYNRQKRCRKLSDRRSLYNPIVRGLESDNIYNYWTQKPRRTRRILKVESFTNSPNIRLVIIAILILICFVNI